MRKVLTVIAGLVAGGFTIYVLEWIGHRIVPPPSGMRFEDVEAIKAYVATAPAEAFLLLLAAWAGGAFVGGFVASLLAPENRLRHALVVGGIQTLLAAIQLSMVPHPAWVMISGLALFLPFAWLGGRIFAGAPDVAPA